MKTTQEVQDLILDVMISAMELNAEGKYYCFVELTPHVQWLQVRLTDVYDITEYYINTYISTKYGSTEDRLKKIKKEIDSYKENK